MLGIVNAGQLDEDAVLSLALDRRLLRAGLVDAAADDLDRLLDRLAPAGFARHRTEPHGPRPAAADLDGELGVDLAEDLPRIVDPVAVADRENDRIAFDIEAGVADLGVAQ